MKVWARNLVTSLVVMLAPTCLYISQSVALTQGDSNKSIDAKQLAELRDLDALSVSPDGRWAIVQVRTPKLDVNTIEVRWYLLNLRRQGEIQYIFDGGEPIIRKDFLPVGAPIAHRPVWSRTSEWFILTQREGEKIELWQGFVDGSELTKLTDIKGVITSFRLSQNDKKILFEAKKSPSRAFEDLREERENGFLFDRRFVPYISKFPIADEPFLSSTSATGGPTHSSLILSLATGRIALATPDALATFHPDDGVQQVLTAAPRQQGPTRFSGDGKTAAWNEALDTEHPGVAPPSILVAASERSERLVCEHIECSGQLQNILSPRVDGGIVFSRQENRFEEGASFYLWRPATDTLDLLLNTNSTINACEYAGEDLVCFEESPKSPRRVISIDLASGHIETLLNPNPDFLILNDIKVTRLPIRLDGRTIAMAVMAVPGGGPGPLVITSYNCDGFLRGGTGDEYPIFPLVAEGFSVMCFVLPSMRGFAVDEAADANAEVRAAVGPGLPYYKLEQAALKEALRQVNELGFAKTSRRAITGLSAGATFAIYSLERGSYAAAITSSGTYTSLIYEIGGLYTDGLLDKWGMDKRFMDEIRPDPTRIDVPLLINVSDQELLFSLSIYNALKAHDRAVEMYVFAGEAHVKHQPKHRLAIYNRNIDWLRFWLMGEEDPNPAKAEQYERWRTMRDERCASDEYDTNPSYCEH